MICGSTEGRFRSCFWLCGKPKYMPRIWFLTRCRLSSLVYVWQSLAFLAPVLSADCPCGRWQPLSGQTSSPLRSSGKVYGWTVWSRARAICSVRPTTPFWLYHKNCRLPGLWSASPLLSAWWPSGSLWSGPTVPISFMMTGWPKPMLACQEVWCF